MSFDWLNRAADPIVLRGQDLETVERASGTRAAAPVGFRGHFLLRAGGTPFNEAGHPREVFQRESAHQEGACTPACRKSVSGRIPRQRRPEPCAGQERGSQERRLTTIRCFLANPSIRDRDQQIAFEKFHQEVDRVFYPGPFAGVGI